MRFYQADCACIPSSPSSRPLVFAHRGGSALAPENTIAAFDNGLALGADGLELDVHLSRDGVVVVHHDRDAGSDDDAARARSPIATADELRRAARAGAGRRPRALSRRADHHRDEGEHAPSWPRARRRRGPPRRCGRARLPRIVRAGACCARRARSSRASPRARRARRCGGRCTVRGAAGRCRAWRTPAIRCRSCRDGRASCRRGSSTAAHRAGLGVQVWTVDTEEDARRLLGWGVDALITDRPDRDRAARAMIFPSCRST